MNGKIAQVIGPVVDVAFEGDLPALYDVLEVQAHIGSSSVRTIAMGSTDGLQRGVSVTATGRPISVPVGKPALGSIFNVTGDVIDGGEVIAKDAKRNSIHQPAPRFEDQSTKVEI